MISSNFIKIECGSLSSTLKSYFLSTALIRNLEVVKSKKTILKNNIKSMTGETYPYNCEKWKSQIIKFQIIYTHNKNKQIIFWWNLKGLTEKLNFRLIMMHLKSPSPPVYKKNVFFSLFWLHGVTFYEEFVL